MDINHLLKAFGSVIDAYSWLAPILLLILIAFLKSPFMKGTIGELRVNIAAQLFLDKKIYTLFKNVTLKTEDGSTQIDHVIVSRYGIFVIETKNIKGWIFGRAQQKMWTQQIYKRKWKFQNPLLQNYKHTQTLQSELALDPNKLFSLVVFVGNSYFKTPMPDNVVFTRGCIRFIKRQTKVLMTEAEVLEVCEKIQSKRLTPIFKNHRDHVKHVKSLIKKKQQGKTDEFCHKCGSPMVLRTVKSGIHQGHQFWGCSAYPKCTAVRQIS
ncbi:NERD domain-containing protein [Methylomonas sp. AM2-LC]|uniref:nuclease-related domain-containing protein n=1 Tax=Methylomonas sp. AM2-LC TaxID=3153301 RepID=UPI0032647D2D